MSTTSDITTAEQLAAMVLVADPGTKTFHVYRSPTDVLLLATGQVLDAGDEVTDWELAVDDAFE